MRLLSLMPPSFDCAFACVRRASPCVPTALPYIVHAEGAAIEDELMPWEARVVPRREKIAEWLAETGMDKFLDLIQITFRYVPGDGHGHGRVSPTSFRQR